MRFSTTVLSALAALGNAQAGAADPRSGQRRSRTLHEAKSDACSIAVVKKPREAVFECEMDPADVDGKTGVRRKLKALPRQMKALRAMLASGQLVSGESVLLHEGASFDDEQLYVPPGLDVRAKVMGREERRLAEGMFPVEESAAAGRRLAETEGEKKESFVVEFVDVEDAGPAAMCDAAARSRRGTVSRVYRKARNGCVVVMTKTDAQALASNPNVKLVQPEEIEDTPSSQAEVGAAASQEGPPPALSWGLDRIKNGDLRMEASLDMCQRPNKLNARGVKIFILNTGINADHHDFGGLNVKTSSCHKSFMTDDHTAFQDDHGQGTHVASTVCGKNFGVADCDHLCAIKVLDENGVGTFQRITDGFNHAISECNNAAQEQGGDPQGPSCVINVSLGGVKISEVKAVVDSALEGGILVVIAAAEGNSVEDSCAYTSESEVSPIRVGSTNYDGEFVSPSSCVDIYAPGVDITAAWIGPPTAAMSKSGTSMASAHVAGIGAAVLKAAHWLNPAGVMGQMTRTQTGAEGTTPGIANTKAADPNEITCQPGKKAVQVIVTTDNYPRETSWRIKDECTGVVVMRGGRYPDTQKEKTYKETVCLSLSDQKYTFTIFDEWGDGNCAFPENDCGNAPSGSYTLNVDAQSLTKPGRVFKTSQSIPFGSNCAEAPAPTTTCKDPEELYTIETTENSNTDEITWTIVNLCSHVIVGDGGPYSSQGSTNTDKVCLRADQKYLFTMYDNGKGTKYELKSSAGSVEGVDVSQGDPGTKRLEFGEDCARTSVSSRAVAVASRVRPLSAAPAPVTPDPVGEQPTLGLVLEQFF